MYTAFFGLNEKPFAITPDPRYLFMSERHGEGLAHLVYGVTESGGFIQLTGEVGTGKTTLVRTLLSQMPTEVNVALVLNPQVTALEFLSSICDELGVPLPQDQSSSKAIVDALNRHLLETHANGRRTILLVDEAQNLSEGVLEQVRLLTNLETAKQKLLQIILIGQEELRDLLAQNNLRQLAQRVTGRYHLQPLSRDETVKYIEHRLRVAGALTEIFEPAAKRAVYQLSGGIPRLVNVICDRALLGAYSSESRVVTKRIVRRAAREITGDELQRSSWPVPTALAASLVIAALAAWFFMVERPTSVVPVVSTPAASSGLVAKELALSAPTDTTPLYVPDATAQAAPPTPRLTNMLHDSPVTLENAMRELFDLWQIDYQPGSRTACQQAAALGLSCMFNRGTWNVLKRLNHPAILTLIDEDGDNHYPVVTTINGDNADLLINGTRVTLPIAEVEKLWFGQHLLLWQPPNGLLSTLQPGTQGENVAWLRSSLATLDESYATKSDAPDVFDADLERALKEFQRRNRLQVDGVAGPMTLILINSLLADENTPLLSAAAQ
ncbi:MAG: AAA family ATPase [Woeseia sp.]|nr:AAA family ATPase [Woeseia sp.]MBT8095806.1 AAA family ATPase [Woeseia sp.]NNE61744.1 AAA family ATPase [Woeseia sp.]NNL54157.1 AAA family ATPase [Woeseia sp.]